MRLKKVVPTALWHNTSLWLENKHQCFHDTIEALSLWFSRLAVLLDIVYPVVYVVISNSKKKIWMYLCYLMNPAMPYMNLDLASDILYCYFVLAPLPFLFHHSRLYGCSWLFYLFFFFLKCKNLNFFIWAYFSFTFYYFIYHINSKGKNTCLSFTSIIQKTSLGDQWLYKNCDEFSLVGA